MSLQLCNLPEVPEKSVLLPFYLYLIALESLLTNDTKNCGRSNWYKAILEPFYKHLGDYPQKPHSFF